MRKLVSVVIISILFSLVAVSPASASYNKKPKPGPTFLNWKMDPKLNWEVDPKLNWKADPKLNWKADPKLNWKADPQLNPMGTPCDLGIGRNCPKKW